ncbi:transposase [Haloplasma contractile]|uniref:Transposase protein n=1 Tax=Haloplasma contractile SSD-17B TaxID=1033810 RepID=U2EFR6_9MOLU|nr:transposase [Haloplasma contractile]ERJ13481.1 hypothetical protein HLPCO_000132 [Haloplasma contractile SSD-17B]
MGKNSISIKEFIKQNKEELENNPNVLRVGKTITYSPEFKVKAVELREQGYSTREIFEDNGLCYHDPSSYKYIKKWTQQYKIHGRECFFKETRGRNANGKSGRPKKQELTVDEKVLIQEKIIEAQKQEIENLKKRLWLGKVVEVSDKYMPKQMIFSFIHDLKNRGYSSITSLCEYFSVSRSGYNKWVKTASERKQREKQDLSDFKDIKYIWLKSDKTAGYRTICMNLRYELAQ